MFSLIDRTYHHDLAIRRYKIYFLNLCFEEMNTDQIEEEVRLWSSLPSRQGA
jgi:hypothetical protein